MKLTAQGIGGLGQQAWSRYDCQVGKSCTVAMGEPGTTVRASFAGVLIGVVVKGRGRVTSDLGGIDCGSACVAGVPTGTKVQLTAGGSGSIRQLGGRLPGDGDLQRDGRRHKGHSRRIRFAGHADHPFLPEHAYVSVDLGGLGTGSVNVSGPQSGSATCEQSPCTKQFDVPERVALTAAPGGGSSRFDHWLGGCPPDQPNCRSTRASSPRSPRALRRAPRPTGSAPCAS